jgi:hypothetical protein
MHIGKEGIENMLMNMALNVFWGIYADKKNDKFSLFIYLGIN